MWDDKISLFSESVNDLNKELMVRQFLPTDATAACRQTGIFTDFFFCVDQ
jgi:hypothetical protein